MAEERTFSQADVDEIVRARLTRERSKYPTEEEMKAYHDWVSKHEAADSDLQKRTKERDQLQEQLDAANKELEASKHNAYIASKGLTGDKAEFIAFKAGKMVDDKTTFEAAVDELTKDKGPEFDWSGPAGGGDHKPAGINETMNKLIRGAYEG